MAAVTAITSFVIRRGTVGASETALTAGVQYELIDPAHGIVLVNATSTWGHNLHVGPQRRDPLLAIRRVYREGQLYDRYARARRH